MNLGDVQLRRYYRAGSIGIEVNSLAPILAAMDAVPSRVTIFSTTTPGLSTTYLVTSISGTHIILGAVQVGTDRDYAPGSPVQLQCSVADAAAGSSGVTQIIAGTGLTGGTITTTGTIALAATGATLTQANQAIPAPADGATVTFDLSSGSVFHPAALGGNRTLALSNAPTATPWARPFTIILTQGTGGQMVTWFGGIKWAGGSQPTLSLGAGAIDAFIFLQIGNGFYLGQVVGQAYA